MGFYGETKPESTVGWQQTGLRLLSNPRPQLFYWIWFQLL